MGLSEFKEKLRSKISVDVLIVGIAILTLLGAILFFFEDSLFSNDGKNGEKLQPVGRIVRSHNDVRRRIESALSWGTVASSDLVYEGDSIFTGDGSDAKILFDKGTELSIDPKSLVVIRTKGSQLEVDLQYGSLEGKVKQAQQIVLNQNGVRQKIAATKTSKTADIRIVRTEKSSKMVVQSIQGTIKVQDKEVKEDESAEVVAGEAPVVTKVHFTILAPRPGKTLWLKPTDNLHLSWKTDKPKEKSILEFSNTESFDVTMSKMGIQGSSYDLKETDRQTGTMYWRVRSENGDSSSLPASFTLYKDLPPRLDAPADKYLFTQDKAAKDPKIAVSLSWNDQFGSLEYQLQVARDSQFTAILVDEKTKVPNYKTAALAPGSYFWRVKGLHPERENSPWSTASGFEIEAPALPLTAPKLAQTELNYQVPPGLFNALPAADLAAGKNLKIDDLPSFKWGEVRDATGYEVEVADNSAFQNSQIHQVTDTSFAPGEVKPGTTFARVRATRKNGDKSELSAPGSLNVVLPGPQLDPVKPLSAVFSSPSEMTNDKTKYTFKLNWKPLPFADSYEVQWGADPQFKLSKTFRTKDSVREVAVSKAMAYSARVRALDAKGTPISLYSTAAAAVLAKKVVLPKKIKIVDADREVATVKTEALPPPPPAPPVKPPVKALVAPPRAAGLAMPMIHANVILSEPQPETALISLESSPTFVNFKWKAVKAASYYVIQIAKDADFTKTIAEKKVSKNSFVFQKPLPEGKVFWRVRYQQGKNSSEWSDVSDLTMIYQ